MKNYSTIYVNPVERISVQGRHNQIFTVKDASGQLVPGGRMNKQKEFGAASEYSFPFNPNTNKLQTGLDVMIKNPFEGLEPKEIQSKYGLPPGWGNILPELVKQSKISKQTYFEIKDSVDPDFYTATVNGQQTIFNSPRNLENLPAPNYLQRFKIILYDGPNYFEDTTPRGRLAMQLCKVNPYIANSKADVNNSLHHFYISEENEAEVESLKKQDVINEGIHYLYEVQNRLTDFKRYQLAILLKDYQGTPLVKGVASPEKVKNSLNLYIHQSGNHQIENIEKFVDLYQMSKSKEKASEFHVRYLVQQALNSHVIDIRDGYYVWFSKSDVDNLYKHRDLNHLVNLLVTEFDTYNPKDKEITNFYRDLIDELKIKGIKIEQ